MIPEDSLYQILRSFNPWWATGAVPEGSIPPMRRSAFLAVRGHLANPNWRRALILEGARRLGKTTVLFQLAQAALSDGLSPRRILYVSFDHPLLKLARFDEILSAFETLCGLDLRTTPGRPSALLLLDEVQYTADWAGWLKWLVDQHPTVQVVATGSASARLRTEGLEPSVGRWLSVPVPPLSFREYLEIRALPIPRIGPVPTDFLWRQDIGQADIQGWVEGCRAAEPHVSRYLLLGGFPELAVLNDAMSLNLLRVDVIDRVLKRDMAALFHVRSVLELERLFVYLCLHSGEIVNRETLARELRVSAPTVDNHMKALEAAHLVVLLNNVDTAGKRLLRARPKVYLADPSLRTAVLMQGEELLGDTTAMGHVGESSAVVQSHALAAMTGATAGYWRDAATARKVDLVLTTPRVRCAIEVKYRATPHLDSREGIVMYRSDDPDVRRWVVTRGAATVPGNVLAIPAFAYLFLIGHVLAHGE